MKITTVFLIQLLLWLSVILTGMPTASAAMMPNQQIQAVQSLEDTLFAVHYDQEPISNRVSRIEETVFGQAQTGSSIEARITKLQSSLSPKALGPLSSINKASTAPSTNDAANGNGPAAMSQGGNGQPMSQGGTNSGAPNGYQPRYSPMTANKPSSKSGQQIASNNGTGAKSMSNLNKMQGNGNGNAGMRPSGTSTATVPEAGETDYPTVTQMELKEFGKTFAKEDITQRLTRLENQVFKMPQTGSLSDRTDNLRLVVLGDTGQQATQPTAYNTQGGGYAGPSNNYGQPDPQQGNNVGYNGYPQPPNYGGGGYGGYSGPTQSAGYNNNQPYSPQGNYSGPNTVASAANGGNPIPGYGSPVANYQPNAIPNVGNQAPTSDMMAAMNEVEKEVLGNTYPAEPINTRLDRVETKVFKTTSPEMAPQDRIQRVIAVASAGGAPMTGKAKAKATFQTLIPIILTILPLILL